MRSEKFPHKTFGNRLKQLREKAHQSVAEVSGAVEIDEKTLFRIEQGEILPPEEVLLLLVSHFDIKEQDAKKLFDLAGYGRAHPGMNQNDEQMIKQMLMVIPVDNRILYSDSTNVNVNRNGVVLNFLQQNDNQAVPVSRIGISKEHAVRLVKTLSETLKMAEQAQKPKLLGAPEQKNKKV